MKKILLLALLAISMLPVYSQMSVGVIAGYNLNSLASKIFRDQGYDYYFQSGWRAGIITEHHLSGKFYLQPQLLLNSKGHKSSFNNDFPNTEFAFHGDYNYQYLFLELQPNLVFKQPISKGNLVIGAGPYIGRGISGWIKAEYESGFGSSLQKGTTYTAVKYRNTVPTLGPNEYDGNVSYSRPYDLGFNCQAGYELKNGLFFSAVYSLGLSRMVPDKSLAYKGRTTYFGISVGYFLKRFS